MDKTTNTKRLRNKTPLYKANQYIVDISTGNNMSLIRIGIKIMIHDYNIIVSINLIDK